MTFPATRGGDPQPLFCTPPRALAWPKLPRKHGGPSNQRTRARAPPIRGGGGPACARRPASSQRRRTLRRQPRPASWPDNVSRRLLFKISPAARLPAMRREPHASRRGPKSLPRTSVSTPACDIERYLQLLLTLSPALCNNPEARSPSCTSTVASVHAA